MEHVPVSKSENQTDKPFDFSKYNQPEAAAVPGVEESGDQTPFDFSKYNQPEGVDLAPQESADTPFDFSQYEPMPTAEEQIAEAERFRTWDFSDKNIAENGPVRRDMTPDEIYEAGKAETEKAARQRRVGGGVVRRLVSFGRRK